MKRLVVLCALFMAGCADMAKDAKETVQNAPVEFWAAVKEVLSFIWQALGGLLAGWLQGLGGMLGL